MKIDDNIKGYINAQSIAILKAYGIVPFRGKGLCPFHPDKDPSFTAKFDRMGRLFWKCQACGISGSDIFSFVAKMENLDERKDFVEIAKRAANACGLGYLLDGTTEKIAPNCTIAPKAEPTPIEPPYYLNAEVEFMANEVTKTNLFNFLCRYWGMGEVLKVMESYKVGRGYYVSPPNSQYNQSSQWKISTTPMRLASITTCNAFPYIDINGNVHSIKVIPYPTNDHHRLKPTNQGAMSQIKPSQNSGAYFGTHLLPLNPSKPVALVESEKTALIGSLFMPEYVWIACGGLEYYNPKDKAKTEPLKGRIIHIFPDTDGIEVWKQKTEELRTEGFRIFFRDEVIKQFPKESKLDIADLIIWEMERASKQLTQNQCIT